MKIIEAKYGKHVVTLPEYLFNTIEGIQCMLHFDGYETKYKTSNKLKKAIYKENEIESNFRLKICFYKKDKENKVVNITICKLKEEVTGIHLSSKHGTNYKVILPNNFYDLRKITLNYLTESNII